MFDAQLPGRRQQLLGMRHRMRLILTQVLSKDQLTCLVSLEAGQHLRAACGATLRRGTYMSVVA